MKKILTFTLINLVVVVTNMSSNDFENDVDFFQQKIDGENEYFSDDPYIKKYKSKEKNDIKISTSLNIKENEFVNLNGIKNEFYSDGKLKSEISFRDGKKDGMKKIFYSDGKLKSETSFRDGNKDGFEKLFYSDGRLKSEIEYRNGQVSRVFFQNR